MNNSVLLSVIIPFYNGSKYIKELINSVLDIPIENKEVIIIDDGSKESEVNILQEIILSMPDIRYYRQENQGIVGARNSGLDHANGKYLLFCDQDDKVNPDTVNEIIINMLEQNADIGFFSTKHFDDKGKEWDCDVIYKEGTFRDKQVADVFIRKLITRYAKGEEVISYIGHLWGCVISRQLVLDYKIRFKRFMSIEDDLLFVLDTLDYSTCVVTMTNVGYYWRGNKNSATRFIPYIEELSEKMRTYYNYRTFILKKHNICNEVEMEEYLVGMRQEFLLNLIRNHAKSNYRKSFKLYKKIIELTKETEFKKALNSEPMCPFALTNENEWRHYQKGNFAIQYMKLRFKRIANRMLVFIRNYR